MRGREFLMKDAYSFDLDKQQSEISYNKFFVCYLKTFQRLELKAIPMTAETGPIGGDLSHEFIIISQTGESDIYFDSKLLEQENELQSINYSEDLSGLVNSYKSLYAVSDDKFNQDNFDNNVLKENQTRSKGIEVGHIFSFGTKYSETMKANVLNNDGKQTTVLLKNPQRFMLFSWHNVLLVNHFFKGRTLGCRKKKRTLPNTSSTNIFFSKIIRMEGCLRLKGY